MSLHYITFGILVPKRYSFNQMVAKLRTNLIMMINFTAFGFHSAKLNETLFIFRNGSFPYTLRSTKLNNGELGCRFLKLQMESKRGYHEVVGDILSPSQVKGIDHLRDPRLNKVGIIIRLNSYLHSPARKTNLKF